MAPRPDLLTPRGREFIAELPPFLRDDPQYRAVLHCMAREGERAEGVLEQLRQDLNPLTATDRGIAFFEGLLNIGSTAGQDIEARRAIILGRMRALEGDPSGADWARRITARIGDVGWTYEEHTPGDASPGAVPPQTLRILLPFAANSPQFEVARRVFREETPAEIALVYISTGGFLLDSSLLDQDGFGI
jgi:hypothetical protein